MNLDLPSRRTGSRQTLLIKYLSLLLLLPTAFSDRAWAEHLVFVSLSKDEAIASYLINEEKGTLEPLGSTELDGAPASICIHPDGSRLYVTVKGSSSIAAFQINEDASLSPINQIMVGDGASYLSLHPTGDYLLSSYYAAGKVRVHRINQDGGLAPEPEQVLETDERAHAVVLDPSGKFAFVPHTLPDSIFQFRFDPATGELSANEPAKLQRADHSGPRHLWFHPNGKQAYGSDEQACSIARYDFDKSTGCLEFAESLSSLPADPVDGKQTTSDIEVHPSGKFVYIANRGHDSIAVFSIDPDDGHLKLLQHAPTDAKPRSFNITPDGRFLIAAGQTTGNLVLFSIQEDGQLTRLNTMKAGRGPAWVQSISR